MPIETINPEEFLKTTQSSRFQILFRTTKEAMFWTGKSFYNIDEPSVASFLLTAVFYKHNLASQYYDALEMARLMRDNYQKPREGTLSITELPQY